MKVLHVIGTFNNGGIENLLVNLTRQQVNQGLEVGLMITTNSYSEAMIKALDSRVSVLYVQKPVGNHNPFYFFKINWMYHKFSPDILHLHSPYTTPYFKSLGRKEKRFVHIHNNVDIYGYDKSVNQYLAISQCVYDVYKAHINNDYCTICYNGIDFYAVKEKTIYKDKPVRMVQVGRLLMEVKGQDITLQALEMLIKDGCNLRLEFWGNGPDIGRLRNMVKEKGLESYVKVAGDVDNNYICNHLCDFDIAVYSSRHEGLGIAAIEAMGAGVPVVLSNVDGHKEVSENGAVCSLFKSEEPHSLADEIKKITDNYQEAIALSHKAKKYVRDSFSIEKMASQLLNIYQNY